MPEFNRSRLVLALERKGCFRKELAQELGVTARTIRNWETGASKPSSSTIAAISVFLGFPETFFFREDMERLAERAATFRARSRIAAKQKRSAMAAADMVAELVGWIDDRFELPSVEIPETGRQSPDLVAQIVRTEWMLGQKPIPSMIRLLESRGILVFSLAQNCLGIDAFSFKVGERPVVMLNTMKSVERSRMDGAHELMHIVAHNEETGKKEEEEANAFAGSFLLPTADVLNRIGRIVSIDQLIEGKRRWGVSLSALVYRLHELGIASDWQYRSLFVEISKRGYLTDEPNPIPHRETSSILALVFAHLRDQGVTPRRVAEELSWNPSQLNEFIFGLGAALLPVEGGGNPSANRERNLKLV